MKRGDVYYADLRPVVGSEQGGVRPVLIVQNDIGNKYSPTVICAAITSKMNKTIANFCNVQKPLFYGIPSAISTRNSSRLVHQHHQL